MQQNLDLIDGRPYSMDKHIRNWYHREFNKYNTLHEKPANQLSPEELNWLVHKMNKPSFTDNWDRYMHASHGTHVAGIIASDNPDAEIFSVKYLSDQNPEPEAEYDNFIGSIALPTTKEELRIQTRQHLQNIVSHIIEANTKEFETLADYLNEKEVSVVNGSYSSNLAFLRPYRRIFNQKEFKELESALRLKMQNANLSMYKNLIEKTPGVLYVFAAGNDSSCNDLFPVFPSYMSSVSKRVISVASVDANGKLSGFSNYGLKTVDLAAQGRNIVSTAPGNKMIHMSGTSQAAPQVSRLATKILDHNDQLSPAEVKEIIIRTVDRRECLIGKLKSGGEMNEERALAITKTMSEQSISLNAALKQLCQ